MMGSLQELLSRAYELICNAEATGLVSTESIGAPRADGGGQQLIESLRAPFADGGRIAVDQAHQSILCLV